uniref:Uncharacterized protein n=1 Tax=Ixodes ricinus TaxID=34613 RepID=A0A6B0UHB6_IXORI
MLRWSIASFGAGQLTACPARSMRSAVWPPFLCSWQTTLMTCSRQPMPSTAAGSRGGCPWGASEDHLCSQTARHRLCKGSGKPPRFPLCSSQLWSPSGGAVSTLPARKA